MLTQAKTKSLVHQYLEAFSVGRWADTAIYRRWTNGEWRKVPGLHYGPKVVSAHVRGPHIYGVEPPKSLNEGRQPAYTTYLDFDLDLPNRNSERTPEQRQRDVRLLEERFESLWRLLRTGILLRSREGRGLRYLIRFEREGGFNLTHLPSAVEQLLKTQGIDVVAGAIEVFPKRGLNSRLPFARDYELIDPDSKLPISGGWETGLRLFQESEPADDFAIEALRRLDSTQFFVQTNNEKLQSAKPGRPRNETIAVLETFCTEGGLTQAGQRQMYAKHWALFLRSRGYDRPTAEAAIADIFEKYHNGKSATINRNPRLAQKEMRAVVDAVYDLKDFRVLPSVVGRIPPLFQPYLGSLPQRPSKRRRRWITEDEIAQAVRDAERHAPNLVDVVEGLYAKASLLASPIAAEDPLTPMGRLFAGESFWLGKKDEDERPEYKRIGKLQNRVKSRAHYLPTVRQELEALGYIRPALNYRVGWHPRMIDVVHPRALRSRPGAPTEQLELGIIPADAPPAPEPVVQKKKRGQRGPDKKPRKNAKKRKKVIGGVWLKTNEQGEYLTISLEVNEQRLTFNAYPAGGRMKATSPDFFIQETRRPALRGAVWLMTNQHGEYLSIALSFNGEEYVAQAFATKVRRSPRAPHYFVATVGSKKNTTLASPHSSLRF